MAQTFHDLCRERKDAGRGLFGFALWIFYETLTGIAREYITHMNQLGKTVPRGGGVRWGLAGAAGGARVGSHVVRGWRRHLR